MRARFLDIAELREALGRQEAGMAHVRPVEGKQRERRMPARDGITRAV